MGLELRIHGRPSIVLDRSDIKIGSHTACTVVVPDANTLHATMRLVGGRWFIEAVDDAPVSVNGSLVQRAFVKSTDEIRIAGVRAKLAEVQADVSPRETAGSTPLSVSSPTPSLPKSNPETNNQVIVTAAAASLVLLSAISIAIQYSSRPAATPPQQVTIEPVPAPPVVSKSTESTAEGRIKPVPVPPKVTPSDTSPLDHLVLVGVSSDAPEAGTPAVLGFGCLLDSRTVITSRGLAQVLDKLERPNGPCIIQGVSIPVRKISHPVEANRLSLLHLTSEAHLQAQPKFRQMAATDFERERQRKVFKYASYHKFERPPREVILFDAAKTRLAVGHADFVFEIGVHILSGAVHENTELERGGLIVDENGAICGICDQLDGTIVWGAEFYGLTQVDK